LMRAVIDLALARQVLCTRLMKFLHGLEPALREDVRAVLAMEGKLLHQPELELDGRWALLPFCLVQDLGTSSGVEYVGTEAACNVALAMECVVGATDLLDDVMDDDRTPLISHIGVARALNAALALVSLSQRMLLALLELDLSVLLPLRLMDMMQETILQAATGQQQDLLAERRRACELTREECLAIAAAKAGALLRLACQMGALCAGLEEERVECCAEMGRLLGVAAQLDNDAHDLSGLLQLADQQRRQKSDLKRGKKTLPVVLAAHSLRATHALEAVAIDFQHLDQLASDKREIYLMALQEGILTTWGLALLYRQQARETLKTLVGERSFSPALCRVLGLDDTSAGNAGYDE